MDPPIQSIHTGEQSFLELLPFETIEHIIDRIVDPGDLSAFSRTCRILHSMIVPHHLHWRSLHIEKGDRKTLIVLAKNPLLASRVYRLAIGDQGHRLDRRAWIPHFRQKPRLYYAPVTDKSEHQWDQQALEDAAYNLKNLIALRLLLVYELIDFDQFLVNLQASSPVLTRVLVTARSLSEINRSPVPVLEKMGGYTHFEWRADNMADEPVISAISDMLHHRCPDLQAISISFASSMFGPVVRDGFALYGWPNLQVLHLTFVQLPDNLGEFLNEHPLLELISLVCGRDRSVPPFTLLPNALPYLREITMNFDSLAHVASLMALIRPLPNGQLRPITGISSLEAAILDDDVLEDFCRRLGSIPTLQAIGWYDENGDQLTRLSQFGKGVQTVTTLLLIMGGAVFDRRFVTAVPPAVSSFSSLTRFELRGNVKLSKGYSWNYGVERLAKVLQDVCPTLQDIDFDYVQHD